MTASLTAEDRSRRLVDAVARALPCDAVVLLRLDGEDLVPVAARGVAGDLLGRRFPRAEQPRLDAICASPTPTRFPADSPLPDPYDGLVGDAPHLLVHSCLGCPLLVEGQLVGALTADALEPGAFDAVDEAFLVHLAALAAAALRTSDLIDALERSASRRGLVVHDLLKEVHERRGGPLVGTSEAMAHLRTDIELVAASGLPVLVSGETGVGKELVVRRLHALSPRAAEPLVYVNCAALPDSVVESELFGHVRGAFTGADKARPGKFRVADGASLFLDEVGELPLALQPKLLRALQEGEIQPVGADHTEQVDVRIVAATNRDLAAEVAAGRFRADLLHRLDVCRILVPPLRDHREDVPQLAGHFADRTRQQLGCGPVRLEPAATAALTAGAWPGNARELENVIARAVLRASGRVPRGEAVVVDTRDLGADLLPADGESQAPSGPPSAALGASGAGADLPTAGRPLTEAVRAFQREAVRAALAASGGNWAAAARSLGLHRSNLHHLARRLGLR